MNLFKKLALTLAASSICIGAVLYYKAEYIVLGAESYIFGYPLVIMHLTEQASPTSGNPDLPLVRVRQFPDATFKAVVRPNVDTLYSAAFIKMSQGPWVFEMAPNQSRYEVMPFMDAWTNVYASLGTRNTGKQGGTYLLVGPNWRGDTPKGMTVLRSPTDLVWLIGRTQTNSASDYSTVHTLQDGLELRKLSQWSPQRAANTATKVIAQAPVTTTTSTTTSTHTPSVQSPINTMQAMSSTEFFNHLTQLMVQNPAAPADAPMLLKMERIGLVPGQAPQWNVLERWAVGLGRWIADRKVKQELQKPRDLVKGWSTPPSILGQYGTHYNIRAVVAMVGLGANLPADAMYPNAAVDGLGQPLNGAHHYKIHFAKDQLPAVNAFWSLTAYGKDDFLIPNTLNRYAIGDRDPLVYNADGSLDIWIQATAPQDKPQANWLPVKKDEPFILNARLYWPKETALQGLWGMPAIERLP